ncbi:MAG TPA: hypothetical protein VNW29_08090 [Candidatus Sulfotelmatobacter sp.]|jgi:hypothetical protein|nr:hypothetical protein [Candidatus Sulfotelmatobacter sp.]
MKTQDILFILILFVLLFLRKPRFLVVVGLFCLVFSIPLFSFWVFFTAERLVMYAAGFLLAAIILFWFTSKK